MLVTAASTGSRDDPAESWIRIRAAHQLLDDDEALSLLTLTFASSSSPTDRF
jgi:hypothetical protein